MEVGKTIQALEIACLYQVDRHLIIVPPSLRICESDEIMKLLDFVDQDQIKLFIEGIKNLIHLLQFLLQVMI